ncbi:MAG TPA: TonB-dependent receptor [Gemmatimonadales bacterium]|jgi:iron complex outermembrane receptor protein|nr:TonB-dependent receptor [Gemmatimonadales bacterium]
MRLPTSLLARTPAFLLVVGGLLVFHLPAAAQGTGTVKGTVTQTGTEQPLVGVNVTVNGTTIKGVSNTRGVYTIENVPAGAQTLTFRWLGYRPVQASATVTAGSTTTVDAKLEQLPIQLSELMVTGASKVPERSVEAPAAFSIVEPRVLQANGITGQVPMALREVPGVDLAQSGMNDFNVNARGFNSTLNRRVLVLQDGRDLAIAFLGSQEWNAMAVPTDEISKMELVRGPGSALYGANAFFGVLNITTPTAREVVGTRITLGGGLLNPHRQSGESFSGTSLRADVRTAGVVMNGRLGYRFNAGYNQSDSWSQSRTSADCMDLQREYAPVVENETEHPIQLSCEVRPLKGQTRDAAGLVSGDPDPTRNIYGSGRFDYYAKNGSVLTAEVGGARVQNELFVTGIGRVQVVEARRPYARLAWASEGFNVMAYFNGRNSLPWDTWEPEEQQFSLASGAPLKERSRILHLEAQDIERFAGDKGRVVFGGSARNYRVDTHGTLMLEKTATFVGDDHRSDYYYSTFGQIEYQLLPKVRGVAAARVDIGTLIDPQFSPKLAVVVSPNDRHSFRVTLNRAFQTPNYSEFFLHVPAAAPANLTNLEAALRASPLGPALAGVPSGTLFTTSSAVPVVAMGNRNLDVETTLGLEAGWRADLSSSVYVTLDAYYNRIRNFVTDLLPVGAIGVKAYPYWTAPGAVPTAARAALVTAVQTNLTAASPFAGANLTRDAAGNTVIGLSYANAGKVNQWGLEAGAGWQLTRSLRSDATLTLFDYSVDTEEAQAGDSLLANTPSAKGTLSLAYAERQLSAATSLRVVKGFSWAAGAFAGYIEPSVTLDANVGYDINNNFKVFLNGNNVLNNRTFSVYGGSVNGRRIMGGVTTRF